MRLDSISNCHGCGCHDRTDEGAVSLQSAMKFSMVQTKQVILSSEICLMAR